jgi:hypothetical protein
VKAARIGPGRWWTAALAAIPAGAHAAVAAGRHALAGPAGATAPVAVAPVAPRRAPMVRTTAPPDPEPVADELELWLDVTGTPAGGIALHNGRVTVHAPLDAELGARLWDVHHRAMAPLSELAVLDHQLGLGDLLELAADPAAITLVAWTDGRPSAFVLLTSNLDAAPQISAAAFAVRYPDAVARGAVLNWVCVASDPDVEDTTAMLSLMRVSCRIAAARRGVIVLDLCHHNRSVVGLERAMRVVARRNGADGIDEVDSQTWYAVTFTEADAPLDEQVEPPAELLLR